MFSRYMRGGNPDLEALTRARRVTAAVIGALRSEANWKDTLNTVSIYAAVEYSTLLLIRAGEVSDDVLKANALAIIHAHRRSI